MFLETLIDELAVKWLLNSTEPAIRYLAFRDVLQEDGTASEVVAARNRLFDGPIVRTLLSGQQADGGFGVHPYQKWTGAHWRLVSLVELGVPSGFEPGVRATDLVLKWLSGDGHSKDVPRINGLYRRCASQEGNALAVCSRLGIASDPRVVQLATSLVEWQWPDGGWNCDREPEAHHSSFNESLATLWGLTEYSKATGDQDSKRAADKAAEFFLKHRIFKSCRNGDLPRRSETFHGKMRHQVHPLTSLHYPLYWHYDILQALIMLSRAGKLSDPRTKDAPDLLKSKRSSGGTWRAEAFYWSLKTTAKPKPEVSNVEIVDWGRKGPSPMITLNALRVLSASKRIKV